MATGEAIITNQTGLHARPALVLVNAAKEFEANIKLLQNNREANLKSLISIMSLAIGVGESVVIEAEGPDAQQAVDKIIEIIQNDFNEE